MPLPLDLAARAAVPHYLARRLVSCFLLNAVLTGGHAARFGSARSLAAATSAAGFILCLVHCRFSSFRVWAVLSPLTPQFSVSSLFLARSACRHGTALLRFSGRVAGSMSPAAPRPSLPYLAEGHAAFIAVLDFYISAACYTVLRLSCLLVAHHANNAAILLLSHGTGGRPFHNGFLPHSFLACQRTGFAAQPSSCSAVLYTTFMASSSCRLTAAGRVLSGSFCLPLCCAFWFLPGSCNYACCVWHFSHPLPLGLSSS